MCSGKDKQMSPRITMYVYASSLLIALSQTATPLFAEENTSEPPLKVVEETSLERGKELFTNICSHCHNISYEYSTIGASGLQGVLERHDETWINTWLTSPEALAKTDVAAQNLAESNPFGLTMPTLPAMQDENNRRAVIEYLKTLK